MERVRCVVCGLLLALGLSLCPVPALASEGFLGGLEDLVGSREVEAGQDYEREFQEDYEPRLEEVETVRAGGDEEELTLIQQIRQFVARGFVFNYGANSWSMWTYAPFRAFLIWLVPIVIVFVFMWFGLRKSIKVIFGAFRKGRFSV